MCNLGTPMSHHHHHHHQLSNSLSRAQTSDEAHHSCATHPSFPSTECDPFQHNCGNISSHRLLEIPTMHEVKLTSATAYLGQVIISSQESPSCRHLSRQPFDWVFLFPSLIGNVLLSSTRLQVPGGIDNCIMRVSDGPNVMPWMRMPSHLDKRHDISVVVSSPT